MQSDRGKKSRENTENLKVESEWGPCKLSGKNGWFMLRNGTPQLITFGGRSPLVMLRFPPGDIEIYYNKGKHGLGNFTVA